MRVGKLLFTRHSIQRMFERHISSRNVAASIREGVIIERYQDDEPFPSVLILGKADDRPLHVLVAVDEDTNTAHVVTCYWPDAAEWSDDFRTRRKR